MTMKTYVRLKEILDKSVGGEQIGAHGAFWRALDLPSFLLKRVYGKQLVVPGDPGSSNLLLALRGQTPFGSDTGNAGAAYPRMPAARPPVSDDDVQFIEEWIKDGCPDSDVPGS